MGLLDLLKEAYADVAPIAAEGAQLFHYKIPGDADVKQLQAEVTALTKQMNTLKGYSNQLLKSVDPSAKAQQDDLRSQVASLTADAQTAIKTLNAAITGIQAIIANTAAGKNVSIDDTSQIASLRNQADNMYSADMTNIQGLINAIQQFFQTATVKPSQVTASDVGHALTGSIVGAGQTVGQSLVTVGQSAQKLGANAIAATDTTAELLKYAPWIVGGAVLIYGLVFVMGARKSNPLSWGD
jgi:ElaB/YqjD/DUF883 family membrane-anchored ribosome-binding protein